MGIFSIANQHIRFAVKLACAIVLALFIGFHFQLETPRWAVLTAAIVAAFAAGGEIARHLPPAGNPIPALSVIAECCVLSGRLLAVSPRLSLLSL
ncbi:hypothetical protein LTSEGIV_4534 [Salmonella enterica subsp. enterica serovar Give str. S5-487]|nr:hypothetical protein LTSEGIV_4534 [Salmonella enterica subsp. enterica serovar Give str. S5-487]